MSHLPPERHFPLGVLLGAAALLALALLSSGLARYTGVGTLRNPVSDSVDRVAIRFADRPDGGVAVYTADELREIEVLAPGTNGFVRSVVRGLVRERKAQGIGAEPAFLLTRWADGRLSLDDPATGRRVELGAFGATNAGVFAQILVAGNRPR